MSDNKRERLETKRITVVTEYVRCIACNYKLDPKAVDDDDRPCPECSKCMACCESDIIHDCLWCWACSERHGGVAANKSWRCDECGCCDIECVCDICKMCRKDGNEIDLCNQCPRCVECCVCESVKCTADACHTSLYLNPGDGQHRMRDCRECPDHCNHCPSVDLNGEECTNDLGECDTCGTCEDCCLCQESVV
jgi:hypothetical protein